MYRLYNINIIVLNKKIKNFCYYNNILAVVLNAIYQQVIYVESNIIFKIC